MGKYQPFVFQCSWLKWVHSQWCGLWHLRETSPAVIVSETVRFSTTSRARLRVGVCIATRRTLNRRGGFDLDHGMQEQEQSRVRSYQALQQLGHTHNETKEASWIRWPCRSFPEELEDRDTLFGFGHNSECLPLQRRTLTEVSTLKASWLYLMFTIICSRYPYVSHLICNAGVGSFTGINWPKAIWQICTDFMQAVTSPSYFFHTVGDLSVDGLGLIWQCNLFGHFCLVSLFHRHPLDRVN
jgi:hypothetical protein